jgi:hypothetical protein
MQTRLSGERLYRLHDRRKPGDRAAPEVVPVRETARNRDPVEPGERFLLVPDERRLHADHVLERVIAVVIAIGAWEDQDREFHGTISSL